MKNEAVETPFCLPKIQKEISENKKFKLPWSQQETKIALQNVLKKFK